MRQDSSHRLATLLRAAQVSLDGVDDTLVRSDRLRGWADTLRARLIDRQGLDFARRRWGAALFGMQQSRQGFQNALSQHVAARSSQITENAVEKEVVGRAVMLTKKRGFFSG